MAVQTARTNLLGRGVLESKDFGLVPATVHVGLARAMARLAAMPFRTLLGIQCGRKVRRIFIVFVKPLRRHVLVAGLARFRAYVKRGVGRTGISLPLFLGFRLGSL